MIIGGNRRSKGPDLRVLAEYMESFALALYLTVENIKTAG